MFTRRFGGFLIGIGLAALLLQLAGMHLTLLWFLDGAGPKLAVVFKLALVVVGWLVWSRAED